MAVHRVGFYCMYFSPHESGQSTLCEHLIGLTAGEAKQERRGEVETKAWQESVSHRDFKFDVSDADKCYQQKIDFRYLVSKGKSVICSLFTLSQF